MTKERLAEIKLAQNDSKDICPDLLVNELIAALEGAQAEITRLRNAIDYIEGPPL